MNKMSIDAKTERPSAVSLEMSEQMELATLRIQARALRIENELLAQSYEAIKRDVVARTNELLIAQADRNRLEERVSALESAYQATDQSLIQTRTDFHVILAELDATRNYAKRLEEEVDRAVRKSLHLREKAEALKAQLPKAVLRRWREKWLQVFRIGSSKRGQS